MKHFFLLLTLSCLMLTGCGNLSPRQQQQIDNQKGKIGEIENLANSMKLELGKMQNQNDIQNSRLDRIQQGLLNLQSNNENSGVQILSGPGGLMFAFAALLVVGVFMLHYRTVAKVQTKTANILAQSIAEQGDPDLHERVFLTAAFTEAEESVLNLMKKHHVI
jgi:hypothetical protein